MFRACLRFSEEREVAQRMSMEGKIRKRRKGEPDPEA